MQDAIDTRPPVVVARNPFAWLAQRFGARATKLEEREKHAPPLAYLLTGAVSLASILVFAHNDIPVLFSPDIAAQAIALVQVAVIVTAVIVGDMCVVRSYYRLEVLSLRGATGMLIEHIAYMLFVMTVNISTYFTVSQANIHALLTGAPIIPDQFLTVEEVARALVVGWTAMQLLITSDKLLVQWSTIMRETAELMGGKAIDWLKSLNIDLGDPVAIFTAYGAVVDSMARPRRRKKAQERQAQVIADAASQRTQVITALQAFGQERLEAARTDGYAQAREDMETMLAQMREEMQSKLQDIVASGPRKPLRPITESGADLVRKALAEAGITLVKKATKRVEGQEKPSMKTGVALRGGWITTADIVTLSGGKVSEESAKEKARRLGDGYRSGTSNACPLQPILRELYDLGALIEPVLAAYKATLSGAKDEALADESTVLSVA